MIQHVLSNPRESSSGLHVDCTTAALLACMYRVVTGEGSCNSLYGSVKTNLKHYIVAPIT